MICRGEKVRYASAHEATVIDVLLDGRVRIEFDDQMLIPPRMDVPPTTLEVSYFGTWKRIVNKDLRCPTCDVPWQETPGFRIHYYDCPICGLRKEDAA